MTSRAVSVTYISNLVWFELKRQSYSDFTVPDKKTNQSGTQTEKKMKWVNGTYYGQLSLSVQLMCMRIEGIKYRFK